MNPTDQDDQNLQSNPLTNNNTLSSVPEVTTTDSVLPMEPVAGSVQPANPHQMPMAESQTASQSGFVPDLANQEFHQPGITDGTDSPTQQSGSGKKKTLIIAGAALLLMITIGVVGYVMAFYLPNRPENVWRTSITRSGEAFDKMAVAYTEKEKLDAFKKTELSMNVQYRSGQGKLSGGFEVKFDETKINGDGKLSYENGDQKVDLVAKIMSEVVQGSDFPNTYFKLSGFAPLGFDYFLPGISELDDKWIGVESDFLESLNITLPQTGANENNITDADVAELVRSVSATSVNYLFSNNSETGVFVMDSFVGKEKLDDGRDAYHYKVKINEDNAIEYCKALVGMVFETNIYKKLPSFNPDTIKVDKNSSLEQCQESWGEELKGWETFDMWVEGQYKLIHKIRIKDTSNKDAYMDIGQNYKGGDEVSMFAQYYDNDKLMGGLKIDSSLGSNTTTAEFDYTTEEDGEDMFVNVTVTAKPHDGTIDVIKPEGTIMIEDVLNYYGITDPASLLDGYQTGQTDTPIESSFGDVQVLGESSGSASAAEELNINNWFKSVF